MSQELFPPADAPGPPPPLPPLPAPNRAGPAAVLLVVVCLGLGAVLAWGWKQQRLVRRQADELTTLRLDTALVAAQRQELVDLLGAAQTQLIPLSATAGASGATGAVLWNRRSGDGILVCQGLGAAPGGERYHLWVQGDSGPVLLWVFDGAAGANVHRFHELPEAGARRFLVSVQREEEGAAAPGRAVLAGEMTPRG